MKEPGRITKWFARWGVLLGMPIAILSFIVFYTIAQQLHDNNRNNLHKEWGKPSVGVITSRNPTPLLDHNGLRAVVVKNNGDSYSVLVRSKWNVGREVKVYHNSNGDVVVIGQYNIDRVRENFINSIDDLYSGFGSLGQYFTLFGSFLFVILISFLLAVFGIICRGNLRRYKNSKSHPDLLSNSKLRARPTV